LVNREGNWIQTYTGIKFYPFDPKIEDICLEDICHSLSMTCRFTGHCKSFYSVAQHSVEIYKECLKRGYDDNILKWALLHDAAEAYVSDVPRPIKQMLDYQFGKCENNILSLIAKKYNLSDNIPKEVKEIDTAILATEARYLMGDLTEWYLPEAEIDIEIIPLDAIDSKLIFKVYLSIFKGEEF